MLETERDRTSEGENKKHTTDQQWSEIINQCIQWNWNPHTNTEQEELQIIYPQKGDYQQKRDIIWEGSHQQIEKSKDKFLNRENQNS